MACAFRVSLKKPLPSPRSEGFSCRSFMAQVTHLGLWFTLSWLLYKVWRMGWGFFWGANGCPIAAAPLVEKTIFSPLNRLCTFIENQLYEQMGIHLWTLSCSLIYVSLLLPIPHILITLTLYWVLKSDSARPPALFYFKSVLVILVSLLFPINFRMGLSIKKKKPIGILIEIALVHTHQLRENWHCGVAEFSPQEDGLHWFRSLIPSLGMCIFQHLDLALFFFFLRFIAKYFMFFLVLL